MAELTRYQLSSELTTALREYCTLGKSGALESYALSNSGNQDNEEQAPTLLALQMLSGSSPDALDALGDCFESGWGLKPSPEAAMTCWQSAANAGGLRALNSLGWNAYKNEDYDAARELYERLLNQTDLLEPELAGSACRNLARVLREQPQPDHDWALRLLTRAAEEFQKLSAQADLGDLYADPNQTYASAEKAVYYYKLAAASAPMDDALYAVTKLGNLLMNGKKALGLEPDPNGAVAFLEQFSKYDDPVVLYTLGAAYLRLEGRSEKNAPTKNLLRVIEVLEQVIQLDPKDVYAVSLLGYAYYRAGYMTQPLSKEGERGVELLKQADKNGEVLHSYILGRLYFDMILYTEDRKEDYRRAAYYYEHAFHDQGCDVDDMVDYVAALLLAEEYKEACRVASEFDVKAKSYLGTTRFFGFIIARLTLEKKVTFFMSPEKAAKTLQEYLEVGEYSPFDHKGYLAKYHDLMSEKLARDALGLYYYQIGDSRSAEREWRAAFDAGSAESGVRLGELYEKGMNPIAANAAIAWEWYKRAADAGSKRGKAEAACFERRSAPNGLLSVQQVVRVRNAGDPKPAASTPSAPPKAKTSAAPTESKPRPKLYCRFCGAKIIPNACFCNKCGKKL